jgi:hypothetical protein
MTNPVPIRSTPQLGQPYTYPLPRPEVEGVRRPYTFAATVAAAGSDVLLIAERLRENTRIVHVSVDFASGTAGELWVYPIIAYADAPTVVGVTETVAYSYLLDGPMYYLSGDAMTWRLDMAVVVPEASYLGFRAVNENLATELSYRAVIVTEESRRVPA